MTEEEVLKAFKERDIPAREGASICATIKPGVPALNYGLGAVMHVNHDHVLNLESKGVAIIPRDDRTGKLLEKSALYLDASVVQNLRLLTKRMHLELIIDTPKGEIHYKIPHSVIGCTWHRENISRLIKGALDANQ